MKMSDFRYNLPAGLIAQFPPRERGTSNLLVLDRENGKYEEKKYFNIPEYIRKGDVVVLNETEVLNCRTYFLTSNGKRVEVLFLEKRERDCWFALIGRAKNVKEGDILSHEKSKLFKIQIGEREENGFKVCFKEGCSFELFEKFGHIPLPPYMGRADKKSDTTRYNTVFSKVPGAVAAATASLNLTEDILERIEAKGARIVKIELRIGWGTFAPVRNEDITKHQIHKEYISVSDQSANDINKGIMDGGKVWSFGTTVARALESVTYFNRKCGKFLVKSYSGETDLYIYPGYKWKVVDVLVTNFHLPDSSLILLVNSFAGKRNIKEVYEYALSRRYKFLSYGDSMLIGDKLIC